MPAINQHKAPTPQQVQAEQTRLLEADKVRAAAPASANLPAVVKQQLPASTADSHSRYLDEIAPASIAGRMIKFSKDGSFTVPDDESVIDENVDFIALVPETFIGWIKFNGAGNAPSWEMGLLYDGYQMLPR